MRGPKPGTLYTLPEIAEILGVSVRAVAKVETRAIGKLQRKLLADPDIREYLMDAGLLPAR